jgi:hypothetical protein
LIHRYAFPCQILEVLNIRGIFFAARKKHKPSRRFECLGPTLKVLALGKTLGSDGEGELESSEQNVPRPPCEGAASDLTFYKYNRKPNKKSAGRFIAARRRKKGK